MTIPQITGRKMEITPAIKQYVLEKFSKLERHFSKISSAHFTLETENISSKVEARIHIPGQELFAEEKAHDMYAAIDLLVDKLDIQLKKAKEKMTNHHHPEHQDAIQKMHENSQAEE